MLLSQRFAVRTPSEPIIALAVGSFVGTIGQFVVSMTTFREHHQNFLHSATIDDALADAITWLETCVGEIIARSPILRPTPVRLARWTDVAVLILGGECVVLEEDHVSELTGSAAPGIESTLRRLVRQQSIVQADALNRWLSRGDVDWSLLARDASHVVNREEDYDPT